MSHRDIYVCDRCGHEQNDVTNMFAVSLAVDRKKARRTNHANGTLSPRHPKAWGAYYADICGKCALELGIAEPKKAPPEEKEAPVPEPTVEDLLRELVLRVAPEVMG